jgi:hypothetical protein
MAFVYIHIIWFSAWIGFGVEHYPFGLLTMIVSLEAIFLSTFVMISQNRADAKRQVLADHQWTIVQEEETQNEDLLDISKRILELTQAIHAPRRRRPIWQPSVWRQTCPRPSSIGSTVRSRAGAPPAVATPRTVGAVRRCSSHATRSRRAAPQSHSAFGVREVPDRHARGTSRSQPPTRARR